MKSKKGLGRGLSALIPDADMEFLSQVARGDSILTAAPIEPPATSAKPAAIKSAAAKPEMTVTSAEKTTAPVAKTVKKSESPPAIAPAHASTSHDSSSSAAAAVEPVVGEKPAAPPGQPAVQWLPLADIIANPFQPRRHFGADELADLVASIKEHGILQPVLVRPRPIGSTNEEAYQLVAGERRWRAAQAAGLTQVPAVIRTVDDQQALELAIIENVQRHDISAIDTALAYKRLSAEFKLSQEEIAGRVGKSRSAVANTMRLLDLPVEVRKAIENSELSEGHGRAILLVAGEGGRKALFKRALRDKLSVRELERLAQEANKTGQVSSSSEAAVLSSALSAERKDLQLKLQRLLGTKVDIAGQGKSGRITISYSSLEEFDRICDLLTKR